MNRIENSNGKGGRTLGLLTYRVQYVRRAGVLGLSRAESGKVASSATLRHHVLPAPPGPPVDDLCGTLAFSFYLNAFARRVCVHSENAVTAHGIFPQSSLSPFLRARAARRHRSQVGTTL